MSDIDVVIRISEEEYKWLQEKDKFNNTFLDYCEKLIAHGKPLPKGHGKLVDADEYIKNYGVLGWLDTISVDKFNEVTPTIIEADKEKNDKNEKS